MTTEEAFLLDILEHPDDDAPRLIFADWLEDNGDPDRAEFIRIRIVQERGRPAQDPRNVARATKLIVDNWDRWVKPLSLLVDPTALRYQPWLVSRLRVRASAVVNEFPRGFIRSLILQAKTFLARYQAIFGLTALTHLKLHDAGDLGASLAACDGLRWIRELDFSDYFNAPIGAADMASLANSAQLGRLRTLRLYRNNLGDEGTYALTTAVWLPGLVSLDLTDNGLSAAGLRALANCSRLNNLRVLRLDRNTFEDDAVSLLLDAPWLEQLTHLSLGETGISPDEADELCARIPKLHLSLG
jgi:uncharacterized protein (TIGR02996 family)